MRRSAAVRPRGAGLSRRSVVQATGRVGGAHLGGVRSRQDALTMIQAGATRIGASSALAILGDD